MRGFPGAKLTPLLGGTLWSLSTNIIGEYDWTLNGLGNLLNKKNNDNLSKTFAYNPTWWGGTTMKHDAMDGQSFIDDDHSFSSNNPNHQSFKEPFKRRMKQFSVVHEHHLLLLNADDGQQQTNQKKSSSSSNETQLKEVVTISMETMCSPVMMYDWKVAVHNSYPSTSKTSASMSESPLEDHTFFQPFGEGFTMGTLTCDVILDTSTTESGEKDNANKSKNSYRGSLELSNISCDEETMVIVSIPMPIHTNDESSMIALDDMNKKGELEIENVLKLEHCSFRSTTSSGNNKYSSRRHSKHDAKTHTTPAPHVTIHPAFTSLQQTWNWTNTQTEMGVSEDDTWNSIQMILPLTYTYPQLDQLRSRVYDLTYKLQISDLLTIVVGIFTFAVVCFHVAMARRVLQCVNGSTSLNNDKAKQGVAVNKKSTATTILKKIIEFYWKWKSCLEEGRDERVFYLCGLVIKFIHTIFVQLKRVFGRTEVVISKNRIHLARERLKLMTQSIFGVGFACKIWNVVIPFHRARTVESHIECQTDTRSIQSDRIRTNAIEQNVVQAFTEDIASNTKVTNTTKTDLTYQVLVPENLVLDDEQEGEEEDDIKESSDAAIIAESNISVSDDLQDTLQSKMLPDPQSKEVKCAKVDGPLALAVTSKEKDDTSSLEVEPVGKKDDIAKLCDPTMILRSPPSVAKCVMHDTMAGKNELVEASEDLTPIKEVKAVKVSPIKLIIDPPKSKNPMGTQRSTIAYETKSKSISGHETKLREVTPLKDEEQEMIIDPKVRSAPNSFIAEMLAKSDKICKRKVKSPPIIASKSSPIKKNSERMSPRRLFHGSLDTEKTVTRTSVLTRKKELEQKCLNKPTTTSAGTKGLLKSSSPFRTTHHLSPKFVTPQVIRNTKKATTLESGEILKGTVPPEKKKPDADGIMTKDSFDEGVPVLQDKRLSFINEYWSEEK